VIVKETFEMIIPGERVGMCSMGLRAASRRIGRNSRGGRRRRGRGMGEGKSESESKG
jgi:hypothetical protein